MFPLLSLPDKAVKLLERNIPSFLRMSREVGPKVSRRLCSKPQEESSVQPRGKFVTMICFLLSNV